MDYLTFVYDHWLLTIVFLLCLRVGSIINVTNRE